MTSYFPARDVEEPVTKEFLRAETSAVRLDFAREFADFKQEIRAGLADLMQEIQVGLGGLESRVDAKLGHLELRLRSEIRRMLWLNVGMLTAFAGVIIAAVRM